MKYLVTYEDNGHPDPGVRGDLLNIYGIPNHIPSGTVWDQTEFKPFVLFYGEEDNLNEDGTVLVGGSPTNSANFVSQAYGSVVDLIQNEGRFLPIIPKSLRIKGRYLKKNKGKMNDV